jgi:hypothetical protein
MRLITSVSSKLLGGRVSYTKLTNGAEGASCDAPDVDSLPQELVHTHLWWMLLTNRSDGFGQP